MTVFMNLTDDRETLKDCLSCNAEYNRITRTNDGAYKCEIVIENIVFYLLREANQCTVALSEENDFDLLYHRKDDIKIFAKNLKEIATDERKAFEKTLLP